MKVRYLKPAILGALGDTAEEPQPHDARHTVRAPAGSRAEGPARKPHARRTVARDKAALTAA